MAKVAVVTGSSSGIGYETSLLLARNEFETYATMRNLKKSIDLQEIAAKEAPNQSRQIHLTQEM